jgi:bifunctional enzyme CysN/CysC
MAVSSLANGHAVAPAQPTDLLRVATAGSVDDGKSTLIGRLLLDAKGVLEDQLAAVERSSRERGDAYVDLALLTDGLRAEREQGITIDVAYRYFQTPRRKFVLADTPGHVRYTRNMVTGASTADLALVLVDARKGLLEQSRRHAAISWLLAVDRIVLCVNKMDLVDYDEEAFERLAREFGDWARRLGVPEPTCIPVSALHGDNVVEPSAAMPWYAGSPLLPYLEHVPARPAAAHGARFPVQWVIRPQSGEHRDYRGYAGQVAGGSLRPGEEVVIEPGGARTRIRAIDTYDGPVAEAFPPMSVTLLLEDDLDVGRGDTICHAPSRPRVTRRLEADVCWLGDAPAAAGRRYALKHGTRMVVAEIEEVEDRLDVDTLERARGAEELMANEIGRVTLRTSAPLAVDPFRENRVTGSFILVDEATHDTVGAGMVVGAADEEPRRAAPRSPDVTWHVGGLTRARRWERLAASGATVWLTGLPASGKSTLASALEERLVEGGRAAYRLDGDNLRHGLNGDLGFDRAARRENVRRTAEAARLFADSGAVALVSLVSPWAEDRDAARALHERDGLPFLEVWVDTPLAECERRDPKGLYARGRRGELAGVTGLDEDYEPPARPELVVSGGRSLDEGLQRVLDLLARATA